MTLPDQDRAALRITHMLEAIAGVRQLVRQSDTNTIAGDWTKSRALERGFEIISEASRHLTDAMKESEPDIPWRQVAGLGNILRHDYDGVEVALLLVSASRDLPLLESALLQFIAKFE